MASLMKRGNIYYEQYYVGKKKKLRSLNTTSLQIAKEKLRQHESARFRGEEIVIPTKTSIAQVVGAFVKNLLAKKRARNAAKDIYYLREAFGPVCTELKIKNEKISSKGKKRPARKSPKPIEATYFEWVTTADIAAMIAEQVQSKGIKGKTANRFREILVRIYNWAMTEGGVTMPGNRNPAAKVERYTETKPVIRFLKLGEIDAQLQALATCRPCLSLLRCTSTQACAGRNCAGSRSTTWILLQVGTELSGCRPRRSTGNSGSPRRKRTGWCQSAKP